MSISTQLLNALQAFVLYFVELSILFLALNVLVGYLNARFSETIQKHLHSRGFSSYLKAMFLGAITPFCSCSTIPFFLALLRNKIPLGVSFSYLMTSPLINPIIVAMLAVSFGFGLTLAYIAFVPIVVLAVSVGVSRLDSALLLRAEFDSPKASCCGDSAQKESQNKPKFTTQSSCCSQANLVKTQSCCKNPPQTTPNPQSCCQDSHKNIRLQTLKSHWQKSFADYKKLLPYLVIGMAIGAFIHDFIPQGSLQSLLIEFDYFAVVIAAFVGLLLYIRIEAIIPIGLGLINAGVPLGVVMSLLIAGGGCSLPELILLKSIFTMRLLLLFMIIVLAIAIGFGTLVLAFGF